MPLKRSPWLQHTKNNAQPTVCLQSSQCFYNPLSLIFYNRQHSRGINTLPTALFFFFQHRGKIAEPQVKAPSASKLYYMAIRVNRRSAKKKLNSPMHHVVMTIGVKLHHRVYFLSFSVFLSVLAKVLCCDSSFVLFVFFPLRQYHRGKSRLNIHHDHRI